MPAVKLSPPPLSGQLSPGSSQTVAWGDAGDSSVPLSPNRVQTGRSQDVPEEGSLFHVSLVPWDFCLCARRVLLSSFRRLGYCCRRHWMISVTRFWVTRSGMHIVNQFRGRMPLCHCRCIRCHLDSLIGQISLRFRLCWLWDLLSSGGGVLCPRSYGYGRQPAAGDGDLTFLDGNPALACSSIIHGSWNSLVRRSQLACCTIRHRFGWISLERNRRWQLPSTCNGTRALYCPFFRCCRSSPRHCTTCHPKLWS